jgi:hypothetical protein
MAHDCQNVIFDALYDPLVGYVHYMAMYHSIIEFQQLWALRLRLQLQLQLRLRLRLRLRFKGRNGWG